MEKGSQFNSINISKTKCLPCSTYSFIFLRTNKHKDKAHLVTLIVESKAMNLGS